MKRLGPHSVAVILFLILICPIYAETSVGLGYRGLVYSAMVDELALKAQIGHEARLLLKAGIVKNFSLVLGALYRYVLPSDTSGGYAYRGFSSVGLFLGFDWKTSWTARIGPDVLLSLGGGANAGAAFAQYLDTELLFFHPEYTFSTYFEYVSPEVPALSFKYEALASGINRNDMAVFAGGGLGLEFMYRIPAAADKTDEDLEYELWEDEPSGSASSVPEPEPEENE